MSGEWTIVTHDTRRYFTRSNRADEVASIHDEGPRKGVEMHVVRNGKDESTYLSKKSTIQCLDVKVALSR